MRNNGHVLGRGRAWRERQQSRSPCRQAAFPVHSGRCKGTTNVSRSRRPLEVSQRTKLNVPDLRSQLKRSSEQPRVLRRRDSPFQPRQQTEQLGPAPAEGRPVLETLRQPASSWATIIRRSTSVHARRSKVAAQKDLPRKHVVANQIYTATHRQPQPWRRTQSASRRKRRSRSRGPQCFQREPHLAHAAYTAASSCSSASSSASCEGSLTGSRSPFVDGPSPAAAQSCAIAHPVLRRPKQRATNRDQHSRAGAASLETARLHASAGDGRSWVGTERPSAKAPRKTLFAR